MKATWKDTVIAESNETKVVENNYYFPQESIRCEYFKPSETTTRCPWKGKASYYNIEIGGEKNPDTAWYYSQASQAAKPIENYIAFWKGVKVTE